MTLAQFAGLILSLTFAVVQTCSAQQFGSGLRRDLIMTKVNSLPPGELAIAAGERRFASGARSPWHTAAGPKLFYVVQGIISVVGQGDKVLLQCGPAPKVCLKDGHPESWFFRNSGPDVAELLVVGIDPARQPTVHEMVGEVVSVSNDQVVLAIGDLKTGALAVPRKELTLSIVKATGLSKGDLVMTHALDVKNESAESLIRLAQPWQ
jgi:hypothetical protein